MSDLGGLSRDELCRMVRDSRRLALVACVAALIGLGGLAVFAVRSTFTASDVNSNRAKIAQTRANATVAKAKAGEAKSAATKLKRQVRTLRVRVIQQRVVLRQTRTVLREKGIIGKTGARGERGKQGPGLTPDEVDAAIDRHCQPPTLCGRPPTQDQVRAALDECAQAGNCRGPAGKDGTNGKDAPPVTDAQLDEAQIRYCDVRNMCAGPAGAQGAKGDPGTPAQPFTFTFTDGVTTHACFIDPLLGPDVQQPCS